MINYVLKITFNESVLNDGPHISAKKPKSLDRLHSKCNNLVLYM